MTMPTDYRPRGRDAILTAVELNRERGETVLELQADLDLLGYRITFDTAETLHQLVADLDDLEAGDAEPARFLDPGDRLYGPPGAFLDAVAVDRGRQLDHLLDTLTSPATPAPAHDAGVTAAAYDAEARRADRDPSGYYLDA